MSKYNTQAVANPTFVFGRDTSEMTQEDYLTAIRKINKDIESYVDIKGSEAIKEVVNNLKKDLKVVTALLDTSVTKGE